MIFFKIDCPLPLFETTIVLQYTLEAAPVAMLPPFETVTSL
jgi:hypothetical protein